MDYIIVNGKKLKDKQIILNKFEFCLSDFDIETIKLITSYNDTSLIIEKMGYDVFSWNAHIENLYKNFGVNNNYELALCALEKDFITTENFNNSFRQKVRIYKNKKDYLKNPVYLNYTDIKIIKALLLNDDSKIKEALKGFNNRITKKSYCSFLFRIFDVENINEVYLLLKKAVI